MKSTGYKLLKKTCEFNFLKWGEYMKRVNIHKRKLETIKNMQEHHYKTTTPMDSYFQGLYNGLEIAIAILEDRVPLYKNVEKKQDEMPKVP